MFATLSIVQKKTAGFETLTFQFCIFVDRSEREKESEENVLPTDNGEMTINIFEYEGK